VSGETVQIQVLPGTSVAELREQIEESWGVPARVQQLLSGSMELNEKQNMIENSLRAGSVITLAKKLGSLQLTADAGTSDACGITAVGTPWSFARRSQFLEKFEMLRIGSIVFHGCSFKSPMTESYVVTVYVSTGDKLCTSRSDEETQLFISQSRDSHIPSATHKTGSAEAVASALARMAVSEGLPPEQFAEELRAHFSKASGGGVAHRNSYLLEHCKPFLDLLQPQ